MNLRLAFVLVASLEVHVALAFSMRDPPTVRASSRSLDVAVEIEAPEIAGLASAPTSTGPSPPPPAAKAARVVTSKSPDAIATATAERFPGGYTHPLGTSSLPIFDPLASPFGVEGGTGSGAGGARGGELGASDRARMALPLAREGARRGDL